MKVIKTLEDLKGLVITNVEHNEHQVVFIFNDGHKVKMFHQQDCYENVEIVDVDGDFEDLIGGVVTDFSERSSSDLSVFDEIAITARGLKPEGSESYTWTFYHITTTKGSIVIRWFGESNGYYSESVDVVVADVHESFGWRTLK